MSYRRSIEQLRPARTQKVDLQEKVQSFLTEAGGSTKEATQAEMAICVEYNKKQGMSLTEAMIAAEVDPSEYEGVSSVVKKVGNKTVNTSGFPNVGSKLIHSGKSSASNQYSKLNAGGSDTTPKTDIYGNSNYRISLKKKGDKGGGGRLMSAKGGKGDAAGVLASSIEHYNKNENVDLTKEKDFLAAMKILQKEMGDAARNDLFVEVEKSKIDFEKYYVEHSSRRKELDKKYRKDKMKIPQWLALEYKYAGPGKAVKDVEGKMLKLIPAIKKNQFIKTKRFEKIQQEYIDNTKYQVGDVKVSANTFAKKKVDPKSLTNKELKTQIIDIIKVSVKTRDWQKKLQAFFDNHEPLKKWIVYEAASGLYKFTGQVSSGGRYKGTETAVANKIMVFSNNGFEYEENVIDYSFANSQLVNKVDISYKASGTSKYPKFGLGSSMEYDSLPMLVEIAMESELLILREELHNIEQQYLLNEGIFDGVIDKAKQMYDLVKDTIKNFYENVIKKFFTFVYDLAKEGIKAFLEALGLELDTENSKVSITTPSW